MSPLRGQNNVQGSCDMGSFPHEFSGYRHVSDDSVRAQFEAMWKVHLANEPGLRIPNMFEAALDGSFKGMYIQGEDLAQSDPNTSHVTRGAVVAECLVIQTSSTTRPRSSRTCSCRGLRSWKRTARSRTPSGASRACAR